jgi:hypothetical protein
VTPQWDRRVPDDCETPDTTSAFDLPISARALRRGAEVARRHGRDPDAPLTIAEADALMRALARRIRDEGSSARQESSRELRDLLNRPPKEVAERDRKEREAMRADYRFVKRLMWLIGAPIFALSVWAVREIITSQITTARRDATTSLRLDACEHRINRVEARIDK